MSLSSVVVRDQRRVRHRVVVAVSTDQHTVSVNQGPVSMVTSVPTWSYSADNMLLVSVNLYRVTQKMSHSVFERL